MNRAALTVLLALTAGCAHRDLSPRLERDAHAAALRHLLDTSTRDAAATPTTPAAAHASPMVRATPANVEGPAPVVRAEVPAPGPAAPRPEAPPEPAPDDLLDRIAREGASTPALVRAIDELRWTLQLEGRLADKQRLLDTLGGQPAPARAAEPDLRKRVDALEGRLREAERAAEAARAARQTETDALREANDALRARLDALDARASAAPASAAPASDSPASDSPAAPDEGLAAQLADQAARSRAEITALRETIRALEERLEAVEAPPRRPVFLRRAPEPAPEPPPPFELAKPYTPSDPDDEETP